MKFSTLVLVLLSFPLLGSPNHEKKASMPKEFDELKKLVGTWEGKTKMHGDKEVPMTVTYTLTSGGSALVEKLSEGTPHEMVSVYYSDGGKLAMTHYCALGNQPKLPLKKQAGNKFEFEMTKPVGIKSLKEEHMHKLTITFEDADHITQEWVSFKDGKSQEAPTFSLTRKKT